MEKALFSIICTTCRAKLAVRNRQVIGDILECPKCGSMVQVVPPEGWDGGEGSGICTRSPAQAAPAKVVAALAPTTEVVSPASVPPQVAPPPVAAPHLTPPPVPAAAEATPSPPAAAPAAAPAGFTPVDGLEASGASSGAWSSVVQSFWGRCLVMGMSSALGLGIVLAGWAIFARRSDPAVGGSVQTHPESQDPTPIEPTPRPKPPPSRLNPRWLPDQSRLVASVHGSRLAAQPSIGKLLGFGDAWWRPSGNAVLNGVGVKLEQVERLTWAATDLASWPQHSVVILELEDGLEAAKLLPGGESVVLGTSEMVFHRVPGGTWPHPFAAVDSRTIITGNEDVLRELVSRTEPHLASAPVERLLKAVSPEADFTLVVDLAAARAARCKLPAALLDVWPAEKQPWHLVWESPEGLGLTVQWSGALKGEVALVCEGETAADKVRLALDDLVPAVKKSLPARIESLKASLQAGRFTAEVADQYKFLLDEGLAVLQTAHWDATGGIVWLRMNWGGQGPLATAAAAVDSTGAMRSDWMLAGRAADEANHSGVLAGLLGYMKADREHRFPEGAASASLMEPETRLSWIATLLPYFGHVDWHRRLEFGYNWNSPKNQAVTRQPLPEVVNPVIGPATTDAGFPVTNYVGVAGVGEKAGKFGPDDRRVGVFGYGRQTRIEDITDGASNTIAILGVTGQCGPWAQGRNATVRSLTKPPYVNGPDGFGSGQPDGMLAGMADGSVRFLSKDIDPQVLEALATIHGGESVNAASLDPKPVMPQPKAEVPKPNVEIFAPPKVEQITKPQAAPPPKSAAVLRAEKLIRERLDAPIPQIELPGTPLGQAVQTLSDISNVPISFDPDAMQELGVTLRDPVNVQLTETTIDKALQAILASRNLRYMLDNGQVLVTSPPEHRELLSTIKYPIKDLTGDDPRAVTELAALIQRLVAPESWQSNGGRGTIEPEAERLIVTQTGNVHYQAIAFCEELRVARGKKLLSTRGKSNPELFALTTRAARAKAILNHSVTLNLHEPAPLGEILGRLKQAIGAEIVLDRPALSAAGLLDSKATLKAEKQPLGAALGQLLDPLALAWRAIDTETLQVTTRKNVAGRLELEFYPVGGLLAKESPAALIGRIKGRLRDATWVEGGGPGVIHFDQTSQCLIVLQSQPVQMELEALLAEK